MDQVVDRNDFCRININLVNVNILYYTVVNVENILHVLHLYH